MDKLFELSHLDSNSDMQEILTGATSAVIKVIGVGGGGCNAVDNMVKSSVKNVDFICANTDAKALSRNKAPTLLQLGHNLTRGLGAGSKPEVGKKAAMEDREKIAALLKGTNMLFIAAGMGGGTGTGAAPVVAEIAKSMNILTVGVVTKPFVYEGEKRRIAADVGIAELKKHVDSLIILPNEKLLSELSPDISLLEAFGASDNILKGAVLGITEVINTHGIVSVDFADVQTVMQGRGLAMMGTSSAKGANRAQEAAEKALYSPLLDDVTIDGAKGVLVNISTAPNGMKMTDYQTIAEVFHSHVARDVDLKIGMSESDELDQDELRVTIIATGLNDMNSMLKDNVLFKKDDVEDNNDSSISDSDHHPLDDNSVSDPFGDSGMNKNVFSTPSFFRRNRS